MVLDRDSTQDSTQMIFGTWCYVLLLTGTSCSVVSVLFIVFCDRCYVFGVLCSVMRGMCFAVCVYV
jgi:hypothetical protein